MVQMTNLASPTRAGRMSWPGPHRRPSSNLQALKLLRRRHALPLHPQSSMYLLVSSRRIDCPRIAADLQTRWHAGLLRAGSTLTAWPTYLIGMRTFFKPSH